MPKTVKLKKGQEFTFKKGGATPSKYDWDGWFNGELLLIERSDVDADGNVTGVKRDFEVETDAMPAKLKTAARRRYKIVQISRVDADGNPLPNDGLIIKARDMTPEERQTEDELRAEEKEANKERREAKKNASAAPQPAA